TVAVQANGQLIGRRQRQRQIGQVVEIGEILSLEFQIGIDAAEIERLGNRRADLGAGGPGIDPGLEPVRVIQLDVQQRVALEVELEGLFVERALKSEFTNGIVDLQVAAAQCKAAQGRKACRFLVRGLRCLVRKIPIGASRLISQQRDLRIVYLQRLQYQTAKKELRQHHRNMQSSQLDHVAAAGPFGISDD